MGLTQIVIFGAAGDLTARKLIPALAANVAAGSIDGSLQIIGVSRRAKADSAWRAELAEWIPEDLRDVWPAFSQSLHYVAADALDRTDVHRLAQVLDDLAGEASSVAGRLYYLATAPALFGQVVEGLAEAGLTHSELGGPAWRRLLVEKPFGTDLATARALNAELFKWLREDQIYRIDHYLGKETVQNILAFRFQNAIFEPLWNRRHVESVEISVCEEIGVEGGRGAYYDHAGALRDMVQNHVLQILALIAMEPPGSMEADAVRNEKVKLLQALDAFRPDEVASEVVRAQYVASAADPRAYRSEPGVAPDSTTETYVAIRARIHNWRWSGVPFFLRTGKAMGHRYSEVILRFHPPPLDLLNGPPDGEICTLRPNALHLLLQPEEGIRLGFLVKQPGPDALMRPTTLGFDYRDLPGAPSPPAYQRLLRDALQGNPTLFIRGDETETAWHFADAIRAGWASVGAPLYTYGSGSMGPPAADELMRVCEGTWGKGPHP